MRIFKRAVTFREIADSCLLQEKETGRWVQVSKAIGKKGLKHLDELEKKK